MTIRQHLCQLCQHLFPSSKFRLLEQKLLDFSRNVNKYCFTVDFQDGNTLFEVPDIFSKYKNLKTSVKSKFGLPKSQISKYQLASTAWPAFETDFHFLMRFYYMGHFKFCTKTDMRHMICSISNTEYGMQHTVCWTTNKYRFVIFHRT